MPLNNYTPPTEDCPECDELISTNCVIESDSLPSMGIAAGSTLKKILIKIGTLINNINRTVATVNRPYRTFETANYINLTETVTATGDVALTIAPPTLSVPVEFFNNSEAYIEYEINTKYTPPGASVYGVITLKAEINGTQFQLASFEAGFNVIQTVSKVKLFYISPTQVGMVINNQIGRDTPVADNNFVVINDLTISSGSTIDFNIVEYNVASGDGDLNVYANKVTAFNPNKNI